MPYNLQSPRRRNRNNVIYQIQPLVERTRRRRVNVDAQTQTVNSRIPNFLDWPHEQPPEQNNIVSNVQLEVPVNSLQSGRNSFDSNRVERTRMKQLFRVLLDCVPFVQFLLARFVSDYYKLIFDLVFLFTTFVHADSVVREEIIKKNKRSLGVLVFELLYIFVSLIFVCCGIIDKVDQFNVVISLAFIKTLPYSLTVGQVFWFVTITDFILKLITVAIKIIFTMYSDKIVSFQKRGKVYLVIEATSQMNRSIVMMPPWLCYLIGTLLFNQGTKTVVAVVFSIFYMTLKWTDLISRIKLLKMSILLQNASLGLSPSKEQIQTAGDQCTICQDNYNSPVLLHCGHIFCGNCVTTWCTFKKQCPLCRAKIVGDSSWKDGSTSYFIQLY